MFSLHKLVLFLLVLFVFSYPQHAKASEPVAALAFDEGGGTTAADSSGHGNAATLQGTAGWTAGRIGAHALSLSGTPGSDAEVPQPVVDTTRSFTVSVWVNLHSTSGTQTFLSIDDINGQGDPGGKKSRSSFVLQLRGGRFAFNMPSRFNWAYPQSDFKPVSGTWYHVAGVYDAVAQSITLYLNGVFQDDLLITPTAPRATGPTVIGRGKAGGPTEFADADIDDVRFYQTALSAAEILAVARVGDPTLPAPPIAPGPATLKIDAAHPGTKINPLFYGLMTEEINHSYEGGLYGELLQNRAFKADATTPLHWTLVQQSGGTGSLSLDTTQPVAGTALATSLKLVTTSAAGRFGVANDGYWGIPVKPSTTYQATFYAKGGTGFTGPVTVDIESNDGSKVYAQAQVPRITGDWKQYAVTLKTGKAAPSQTNRFVISIGAPGGLWLTDISLFPPTYKSRPNGSRMDLMQKMADMNPAFLRLPGGNYLEGDTVATRFDWKKTLGPIEQRPGHQGPWGYWSDDGFGLLEFLEWCEDLKMQALLAVYAGYSLKGEHIGAGPALAPFVQDALDEIQYVIGDVHTRWGAQRAADGHPAPFPLQYVEIGNEDFVDGSGSYDGRFEQFYDAIKAAYPTLQLIATTSVKSRTPDVLDEHFYKSPAKFERDVHHYDDYSRKGPKIFVGEWAAVEFHFDPTSSAVTPTPDLNAALGDAAWLTGLERNSDLVVLESYAPLLVNVNSGAYQWPTNLIGYDALNSYVSPSYYVQQMFSRYHGDRVIPATLTGGTQLFESVTRDSMRGTLYLKVVNAAPSPQSVHVTLSGVKDVLPSGQAIVLTSTSLTDKNTLTVPLKVVPITSKVSHVGTSFDYTFPAHSVTVLQLQAS